MYATVLIDISSKQLNRLFDYKIPLHLQKDIKKGMRVVVNFNNAVRLAYVVDIVKTSKYANKEVLYALDKKPIISNSQFKIIEHLQKKSFATFLDCFERVVPNALHGRYEYTFKVNNKKEIDTRLYPYIKNNNVNIKEIKEEDFVVFNKELEKGNLTKLTTIKDKIKRNYQRKLFIINDDKKLTVKQQLIIDDLKEPKLEEELLKLGHTKNIINRLINNEVLGYELIPLYKTYDQEFNLSEDVLKLTEDQQKAINKVSFKKPSRNLLYGPPGSGKTEVYLRLIEQVLKEDKQALIMVPEISLIPQMVSRVKGRFSLDVAVYHSRLTPRQRYDAYRMVKSNDVKIIIGTRSSIFLPNDNLGIIILDEAHDLSYIQKTSPYYDTKEISYLLSEIKNIPVILGTATPTISLYFDATLNKINLLKLSKPIYDSEVKIKIVDMKEELKQGNLSMFSYELKEAIRKTLDKDEQIIILVNRRGYAPFVMCRSCGFTYKCPTCNVSLTYHQKNNLLKCHHCNYETPFNSTCSFCKKKAVKPVGFGSEQVEEQLKKEFSNAKVIRMDSDTTTKKDSHDKLLTKFLNKEANILVGTQMISKGHHFENVSLVVVMLADQMLKLSSFLANENTYNLLTQHIGRIRKKDGLAILQAYDTEHYVLNSIIKKDFNLYYKEELETRRLLRLEPFYNVVKVTFKGLNDSKTYRDLERLKNNLISRNTQIEAFGPSEDFRFYVGQRYHYSVTFKIPKSFNIDSLMNYFDRRYTKEYFVDIDYYPELI